jgi:hypothetical protein
MQSLSQNIKELILDLEQEKKDYYAENHNRTDEHTMYLVGQIDAYKAVLKLI